MFITLKAPLKTRCNVQLKKMKRAGASVIIITDITYNEKNEINKEI